MTPDEFFAGHEEARAIFVTLCQAIAQIGHSDIRVTKSQIAFRRRIGFAYVWMPEIYLGKAEVPLVLTIGLRRRDESSRWKKVVEPSPGRFTHHMELRSASEIDGQIFRFLQEAWDLAA